MNHAKLLTDKEVQQILGVSDVTLWRERKMGRLGFVRVGGAVRYTQSQIDDYIKRQARQPYGQTEDVCAA